MEPEIGLTIMSDGSIRSDGPEPSATTMRKVMEQYFTHKGIEGAQARIAEFKRLIADIADVRVDTAQ